LACGQDSLPAREKRRIDRWFVPPRRNEPMPLEAMRDLLGVVRGIYAATKERGASRQELAKISSVGKQLSDAIAQAALTLPNAADSSEAWQRAEHVTRQVMDLIDALTPVEPVLLAAKSRVTGGMAALKKKRDER
jgi:hypothetical protein